MIDTPCAEDRCVALGIFPQPLIERMGGDGRAVADDDEFAAGARHGNIHAADVFEEADVLFGVAAHKGDDDDVAFGALEGVDGVYVKQGNSGSVRVIKHGLQETYLAPIGRDDADAP